MTQKPFNYIRLVFHFSLLSTTLLSASNYHEVPKTRNKSISTDCSANLCLALISNLKSKSKLKIERTKNQRVYPTYISSLSIDSSEAEDDKLVCEKKLSPNRKRVVRYRGRISYDGSSFAGWQYQPDSRTIQGELESVLSRRFNRSIRIVGAGRTDAGVHARGQAFHFDLIPKKKSEYHQNSTSKDSIKDVTNDCTELIKESLDIVELQHAINSMVSRDIRVWDLSIAPSSIIQSEAKEDRLYSWHAIASSTKKIYSYRIYVGAAMDPLQRYNRAHIHDPDFDIRKLEKVIKYYEGSHDFRAFSAAIEQNARKQGKTAETTDTVRTVYSVNLVKESSTFHSDCNDSIRSGDGNYRIDVTLNGALYKMVRNMMGTAFDVCRGKLPENILLDLLQQRLCSDPNGNKKYFSRDSNPSKPAPPEGLCLEKVFYFDDF